MAAIGKKGSTSGGVKRVSPIKPGLRDARNWASAQVRAASHTRKGFIRFILSTLLLLTGLVIIGLWLGGFLPDARNAGERFTKNRLMAVGFAVDRVDVMGEGRLREDDVRRALGVKPGDYFFGIDLKSAQRRVEGLSWVDHAIVRRLWPDRIVVQIIEKQPYALWQDDGQLKVVDVSGRHIFDADPADFSRLAIFTGEGAAGKTQEIHGLMEGYESIFERADAFIYVGNRWDILLDEGAIRIKLPSENPAVALELLTRLNEQTKLLSRQVGVIDLRLPDRISLSAEPSSRV